MASLRVLFLCSVLSLLLASCSALGTLNIKPTFVRPPIAEKSTAPTCTIGESNGSATLNMSFVDIDSTTGKAVTVHVGQVIPLSRDHNSNSIQSQTSISLYMDSELVYADNRARFGNGSTSGTATWGGSHTANFFIDKDNITTGSVDGKAFNPMHLGQVLNSTVHLEQRDEPLLHLTQPLGFNKLLPQLQQHITTGMDICKSEIKQRYSPNNATNAMVLRRDDRVQTPGHFSNTYWASSCTNCEVLASAGVALAAAICIAGTCWWSFGLGCAACYAAEGVGEFYALAECNFSGACCPIVCGRGSFPVNPPNCCFGDEFCLDSSSGSCCSQGTRACGGKACCHSDQQCIDSGEMAGYCCPTGSVSGSLCCPSPADVWVGGSSPCCAQADRCGSVCCNPVDPLNSGPTLLWNYCADSSRSLCCPTGQVAVNGICCQKGAINCNGQCCMGNCLSNGQCQVEVTDAECQSIGYLGACADMGGCNQYPHQCLSNGCCMQVPK